MSERLASPSLPFYAHWPPRTSQPSRSTQLEFGAARFEGVKKFSEGNIGGIWWDFVCPFKTKKDELQKLDLSLKL